VRAISTLIWLAFNLGTAVVGHKIHGSIFWSVMDFIFSPIAWLKWLICQEVNLTIIKQAFAFLAQ